MITPRALLENYLMFSAVIMKEILRYINELNIAGKLAMRKILWKLICDIIDLCSLNWSLSFMDNLMINIMLIILTSFWVSIGTSLYSFRHWFKLCIFLIWILTQWDWTLINDQFKLLKFLYENFKTKLLIQIDILFSLQRISLRLKISLKIYTELLNK